MRILFASLVWIDRRFLCQTCLSAEQALYGDNREDGEPRNISCTLVVHVRGELEEPAAARSTGGGSGVQVEVQPPALCLHPALQRPTASFRLTSNRPGLIRLSYSLDGPGADFFRESDREAPNRTLVLAHLPLLDPHFDVVSHMGLGGKHMRPPGLAERSITCPLHGVVARVGGHSLPDCRPDAAPHAKGQGQRII